MSCNQLSTQPCMTTITRLSSLLPILTRSVPKAMPPRRTASTAPVAKRPRSRSSSLTDTSTPPPPKKKGSRASRVSVAKWPPAGLDGPYPPRQGLPAHVFPDAAQYQVESQNGVNGGMGGPLGLDGPLLIGAHVSMAKGPATALLRSSKIGGNGLAMFVKGHKTWKSKPFEQDAIDQFRSLLRPESEGGMGYGPESILVHGNYLINLGNPDEAKWNVAYECFKDDLYRCHQLGIKLYNWHPGSTVGACTREESFALVAKAINKVHKEVPEVVTVIENMANAGSNILGTAFSDLASMIALVEDKSRVRVCLDTCHTFAAGYDIRTPDAYANTMSAFASEVGFEYLAGIHLNDSKAPLGGHRDLHENIGLGEIGLTGFRCLVRDPRMRGIPMALETPSDADTGEQEIWRREIALLYEIQKVPDEEWEAKKVEIESRWREERDRILPPKEKKAPKSKSKAKKKAESDDDSD